MADDKLIFPIGFDLNEGVKEALKDGDEAIERLYKAFSKKPITVKLKIDSGEALSRSAKTLSGLKKEMAEINREWNALSAGDRGGVLGAQIMARYRALTQEAKGYTSTVAAAVRLEDKLAREREKSANAAEKAAQKTREYNKELSNQSSYVSNLLRKMVALWSIHRVQSFVTGVREVTAEFELQRVSLGAIIQDQQRANQLFSEIKSFALQSPLKILDLTKYTKQVAAYGIETEKLFDTTKRLADVSVGLGVDMGRLVLAYGQVKAASYLRAAEIRQFTEAGIPMLELLAKKFSDLRGKMVSTEQVMDLVSKRAVSFSMVEEIFNDMTSAGGMFYNMQEKQAQTLFGMWSKLGDAAAVMYDEIGNTSSVNAGMKMTIGLLESMMRNWRFVANQITAAAIAFGVFKTASTAIKWMQVNTVAAAEATRRMTRASISHRAAIAAGNPIMGAYTNMLRMVAVWNRKAALSTNLFTVAWNKLKVAMATWGPMLIITALTTIVSWFISARQEANRLNEELSKISVEGAANADAMVRNFERLANAVVDSADGSKKQHEALEELKRTYSDVIPAQDLTIDKLRAMKGAYEDVAKAIREKIYQQNLERQISTIQEEYQKKLSDSEGETKKFLADYGLDANEIGRVMGAIKKAIDDGILDITSSKYEYAGVLSRIIKEQTGLDVKFDTGYNTDAVISFGKLKNSIEDYVDAYSEMTEKIKERTEYMEGQMGTLAKYTNEWKRVQKEIADNKIIAGPEDSQFLVSKQNDNRAIQSWAASLKDVLGDAWDEAFVSLEESVGEKGDKMSYILFDKLMAPEVFEKFSIQQQNYIKQIQDEYYNLIPKEAVVRSVNDRFTRLANSLGLIDKVRGDMMGASEDLEAYRKKINDTAKDYATQVENLTRVLAMTPMVLKDYAEISDKLKDTKALKEFYTTWAKMLGESKKGGGRTSDPRLQNLKEEISLTKKLYDEYQKLEKQIGATKAAEKIQQIYSNTIKTLQDRATTYKFDFKLPFTDENLKSNMQHFIDKMKELQGLKDKKGKPLFPNIGKEIDEAVAQLEDVDFNSLQKALEKKLKELADRISRTKTAKEFYEKILSQTGDVELAANVSIAVYGSTGEELFEQTVEQIREVFKTGSEEHPIDLDISAAIDITNQRINYKTLADIYDKYQDQIIEKNRNTAENIVKEGQKTAASNIATWEKELAKAKDYEEQRTDIINRETQRRAEIYKSNLPQEEKDRLAAQSQRKQDEDLAKVNFEEFTKSEDYIKIFENLDNKATSSLKRLRAEMQALIDTNQNLSPENMKTLVKAMEDIDEQISGRGFGNDMIQSVNDYITSIKNLKIAKQELAAAEAEYQAQLPQLDENIALAEAEKVEAQRALNDLKNNELTTGNQIVAAELQLNTATANVVKAQQAKAKAADKVKKAEQKVTDLQDDQEKAATDFFKDLQKVASTATKLAGELSEIKDLLGISEDSVAGLVFDSAISSLQTMSTAINAAVAAQALFNAIAESNPYVAIAAAALAVGGAIASWISGNKVRKANKEIERQQEFLDQLEYTYGRLEKAADKVFGSDYISNYNQRLKNLQAQQAAYEKQAQAERSKGKKEDKKKTEEYLKNARETADEIADMQSELRDHFAGTDIASAARDFAGAWIDAKTSFANTTDAMRDKFKDMVQNMIIEAMAAKIMESALQPFYNAIDEAAADGEITADEIAEATKIGLGSIEDMNNGMEVVWAQLKQAGLDVGKIWSDAESGFTGIAKSVAGATSEEINANTAALNTQNYYMSHVPQIAEHVAAMRQLMERATTVALPEASAAGWTDWQKQAMDNYNAIARNTAETVVRCERAAVACEAFAADIHRMMEFSGGKHRLNVKL